MAAETVTYKRIQDGVADIAKLDKDALSGEDFRKIRDFLSRRIEECYEHELWDVTRVTEKRFFRDDWIGVGDNAYAVGDEVYYPVTRGYYQCIRAHADSFESPASGSPASTNEDYWAAAAESYEGDAWDSSVAYVQGNVVLYNELFWVCHTATTGDLPTDITKWGQLTVFLRYVPFVQSGKTTWQDGVEVWDKDPRQGFRAAALAKSESSLGLHVFKDVLFVWLEWYVTPPRLFGAVWVTPGPYAIGDQVYYAATGQFYNCIAAATTELPTDTAKFTVVNLYQHFEIAMVRLTAADTLASQDQSDDAVGEEYLGNQALTRKVFRMRQQKGHQGRPNVGVRR